jgi:hypothetical protein
MHLLEFHSLSIPFPSQNYTEKQASAADLLNSSLFETPITEKYLGKCGSFISVW